MAYSNNKYYYVFNFSNTLKQKREISVNIPDIPPVEVSVPEFKPLIPKPTKQVSSKERFDVQRLDVNGPFNFFEMSPLCPITMLYRNLVSDVLPFWRYIRSVFPI